MSRRRRPTPITGGTTSERDTCDPGLAHRRRGRPALASGRSEVATRRTAGDVWRVAKDGKPRVDLRRWPKLMRM